MPLSFHRFAMLLLFVFGSLISFSQNIFMLVTGSPRIEGESKNPRHINHIDINEISQGNESCVSFSGGNPTLCKPTIGQILFNMPLNTAAIGFRERMFSGKPMDKVDVFIETGGASPVTYQKIRMEDVFVVGVKEVAASGGSPTVQVILQASKIGWVYNKIDDRGILVKPPVKTGWDVERATLWTPAD